MMMEEENWAILKRRLSPKSVGTQDRETVLPSFPVSVYCGRDGEHGRVAD